MINSSWRANPSVTAGFLDPAYVRGREDSISRGFLHVLWDTRGEYPFHRGRSFRAWGSQLSNAPLRSGGPKDGMRAGSTPQVAAMCGSTLETMVFRPWVQG